jgi:hypothetical protein
MHDLLLHAVMAARHAAQARWIGSTKQQSAVWRTRAPRMDGLLAVMSSSHFGGPKVAASHNISRDFGSRRPAVLTRLGSAPKERLSNLTTVSRLTEHPTSSKSGQG